MLGSMNYGYGPGDTMREDVFDCINKGYREGAFCGGLVDSPAMEALIAVLERIGWRGSVTDFSDAIPDRCESFSTTEMIHSLARLGWRAQRWRSSIARLDERLLPAMLFERGGKISVLLGREGTSYGVRRPGGIVEEIEAKKLRGRVFVFSKMESTDKGTTAQSESFLSSLAKRFIAPMFTLLWIALLINIVSLAGPLAVMATYDKVIPGDAIDTLIAIGIGVCTAMTIEIGLRRLKARGVALVAARLDFLISTRVFQHLISMPLEMTATLPIGAQIAKLRQFETVRDVFIGPFVSLGLELPSVILLVIVLFVIGGPFALIPIAVALGLLAAAATALPLTKRAAAEASRLASERQHLMLDTFTQMREIRSNGCAAPWRDRLETVCARTAMAQRAAGFRNDALMAVVNIVPPLAGAITLYVGALQVMAGAMTTGALVASMLLTWRILGPLQQLFTTGMRLSEITESFRQFDAFMRMKGEPRRSISALSRPDSQGELRFADVSFRYPGTYAPALQGISFVARPGELVAVTGQASSGRTTIVRLALALHQPQVGAVLLNGLNLRQHDPRTQRAAIGYVPQSPRLFDGTIADNLRLAAPGATRQELAMACGRTRILQTILNMPQGFETQVSDLQHERFSSSFRQSLALTQALLRSPQVLVLDEAGSAFDVAAEDAFKEQLENLRGVATILLMTSNLQHAAIADTIVALEGGRMTAFGPAEAVMRRLRETRHHAA